MWTERPWLGREARLHRRFLALPLESQDGLGQLDRQPDHARAAPFREYTHAADARLGRRASRRSGREQRL